MQFNQEFNELNNRVIYLQTEYLYDPALLYYQLIPNLFVFFYLNGSSHQNSISSSFLTKPTINQQVQPQIEQDPCQKSYILKKQRKKKKKDSKLIQSAKKNSEANIINQLLSWLLHGHSAAKIIQKAILKLNSEQIKKEALKVILCQKGRKYVNASTILNLFTSQTFVKTNSDICDYITDSGKASIEEVCYLFRVCACYFLRDVSQTVILTSKRMGVIAKREHVKRRHKILSILKKSFR